MIKLQPHEYIVACVPRYAAGPGYGNSYMEVLIVDGATGALRTVALQPEQRTPAMHALFAICEAAHSAMLAEVQNVTKKAKVKK